MINENTETLFYNYFLIKFTVTNFKQRLKHFDNLIFIGLMFFQQRMCHRANM